MKDHPYAVTTINILRMCNNVLKPTLNWANFCFVNLKPELFLVNIVVS